MSKTLAVAEHLDGTLNASAKTVAGVVRAYHSAWRTRRTYGSREDVALCAVSASGLNEAEACAGCRREEVLAPGLNGMRKNLATSTMFDGRIIGNPEEYQEAGLMYYGIAWGESTRSNRGRCLSACSGVYHSDYIDGSPEPHRQDQTMHKSKLRDRHGQLTLLSLAAASLVLAGCTQETEPAADELPQSVHVTGTLSCSGTGKWPGFEREVPLLIQGNRITTEDLGIEPEGARFETWSGEVTGNEVALTGRYKIPDQQPGPVSLTGVYTGESIQLEGTRGPRTCTYTSTHVDAQD